jgi:hypothetical protein
MAKAPQKHRQPWTGDDDKLLRKLARENTPTRVMGLKLQRTPPAVQARAGELRVSLKPVNQSPYNRRKK